MASLSLVDLCNVLKEKKTACSLEGDDRVIHAVNTLEHATTGELTFLSHPKYEKLVASTRASAIIVRKGISVPGHLSAIRCEEPYAAMMHAVVAIHGFRQHPDWGISDSAYIDESVELGDAVRIGPGACIEAKVRLGDRCVVYPGCYIGRGARLGDDCVLFPGVVVYDGCVVGNRVTLHAGTVIGQDGLGYAPVGDKWIKIPQSGIAVIEDDVEMGANCCVDRATLGQTVVGAGTKFGNSVVIGHGTKIGQDCILIGQVGLAGSITVGRHVTLAGQVGAAGHIHIGDGAEVGAQSGLTNDVEAGAKYFGSPALPIGEARRIMASWRKLPDLLERVRKLEREIERLRNGQGG